MLRQLLSQLSEVWEVPRDLALGRYPAFVTGGELRRGQLPIFVFHSLEPVSFERKLRHLSDNGYRTLTADEYLAVLDGSSPPPERGVVMSFDDGRGSLWSVGAPLLRRFGMRGVVFLVPGRLSSRPGEMAPTWDDVVAGRAEAQAVRQRESGAGSFLSWEEVEALAREGVFDFQSHTLSHARIHVAPRVVGFMSPDQSHPHRVMDVPWIRDGQRDLWAREVPLGTPLLCSAPRTSERLRLFEEPAIREPCQALVEAEGGARFFDDPGWRRRLTRALARVRIQGRVETADERETAIRAELEESRRAIEAHTARPVRHLCYPWHVSGPTARALAAQIGYRAAFCGKVRGVPITPVGGDPMALARIGEDYLELLPGTGRVSLPSVIVRKWRRRFGRTS